MAKNKNTKEEHLQDVDRVLEDVREHLERTEEISEIYELRALQLLLEVTKALHSKRDPHALFTLVLESLLSFAEAERAFLLLTDGNNGPRFKMGRSSQGRYLAPEECVISRGAVEEALRRQQPFVLVDAQNDAEFSSRQSVMDLELRTVIVVPLRYKGHMLGLLYADSKQPLTRYGQRYLNVLHALGDQIAVALHNLGKFETHTGEDAT